MKLTALSALALCFGCSAAYADSFQVSYLSAGTQASASSNYVENFNNATKNSDGTYTTNFNGSGVSGTYSGSFNVVGSGIYGGAGGTGNYITTGSYSGTGTPYSLSLSSNVNYFGLWFSALDPGNVLSFYKDNVLLYTFTSTDFIKAIGQCPSNSGYCGNPNNGADSWEQFAFINFYDPSGTFNKVTFAQGTNYTGDFESDNHTIGYVSRSPNGTALAVTPEPSSLALLGTGLLGVAGVMRRRMLGV